VGVAVVDSETRWSLVRKLQTKTVAPKPTTKIRAAAKADIPQIKDIYNFYIQNTVITFDDKPLDLRHWLDKFEHLTRLDLPFLVIHRADEILGFAFVSPWRQRTGYLKIVENQIYLAAAATGKKLGAQLFADLLQACQDRGVKEVIAVIADRGAQASIALHKKQGFVEQGHLANVGLRFGKPIGSYLLSLKL
jgi:phosphinothricin acetyltransferase